MIKSHYLSMMLLTVLAISLILFTKADAFTFTNSPDPACSVAPVGTANTANNPDSIFAVTSSQASATVVVSGDSTCTETVSVASWQAPNGSTDFLPLDQQTLVNSVTETLGTGTHVLTVAIPNCDYQVDLLLGSSPTNGGTPDYVAGQLMGFVQAGNTVCEPLTQTSSMVTTPPAPTPVVPAAAVTPTPTQLVNTGPGNTVLIFAVVVIVGTYTHWGIRRYILIKK